MTPELAQLLRVEKRLDEAAGYLELGMAQYALDCLDHLGSLGPFETDAALLSSEALERLGRRDEACLHRRVAQNGRSQHDAEMLRALSIFHHEAGNVAQAIHTLAKARGARGGTSSASSRPV